MLAAWPSNCCQRAAIFWDSLLIRKCDHQSYALPIELSAPLGGVSSRSAESASATPCSHVPLMDGDGGNMWDPLAAATVSQCTVTPSSERTDCCQAEESAQPEPDLEVNIRKIHSSEGLSDENMPAYSMENTGTSEPFALHGLLPKERLLSCCQGARAAQQQPCTGERQWCARTDSDPLAFLTARGKPGVSSTPVCGSVVNPVTDRGKDQPAGSFTPVKDQPASPFTPVKDQPASAFTPVKDTPVKDQFISQSGYCPRITHHPVFLNPNTDERWPVTPLIKTGRSGNGERSVCVEILYEENVCGELGSDIQPSSEENTFPPYPSHCSESVTETQNHLPHTDSEIGLELTVLPPQSPELCGCDEGMQERDSNCNCKADGGNRQQNVRRPSSRRKQNYSQNCTQNCPQNCPQFNGSASQPRTKYQGCPPCEKQCNQPTSQWCGHPGMSPEPLAFQRWAVPPEVWKGVQFQPQPPSLMHSPYCRVGLGQSQCLPCPVSLPFPPSLSCPSLPPFLSFCPALPIPPSVPFPSSLPPSLFCPPSLPPLPPQLCSPHCAHHCSAMPTVRPCQADATGLMPCVYHQLQPQGLVAQGLPNDACGVGRTAPAATGVAPCCPGPQVPEMGVGSRGTDTDRVQAAGDLFFTRECEELPLGLHSCNSFVPPTPPPTRQTSIFSDTWPETQLRGMSGPVPCSCVGCPINASCPCVSSLCICLAAYLKRLEQLGMNAESVLRAMENQKLSPSARSERPTGKARQGKPSNKTQPGSDSFQNTSLELSSTGNENRTGINKMDRNRTGASGMEAKRTAGTGKARFADNQIPGTLGTGAATQWCEDKLSGSESGVVDWSLAVELDSTSISQEIMQLETEVDAGQTSGEVPQQPRTMCTAFAVGTEERTDIKGPAVGRQGDGKQTTQDTPRQRDAAALNKSVNSPLITDMQVKKLCDWSIVDACISTERIPNIILGQHGTGDYISGGKKDEKTSGAVEVCQRKGCCMAQPRFTPGEKDQSCVNFIPEFLDNISTSANTDDDPEDEIQVMVNVQVESTFSTAVVVDQVKQHVSDALDGVKDYHHQQLQMLQMGMQCRQQMMCEYRKLMEASRARQKRKEEKAASQQHQQSGRTRKDHKSKTEACQIDLENVQPAPQPDPVPAADAQGGQNTWEVCERQTADQSRTTKQPTTVPGKEAEEVQNVQEARQRGDAVQSRTVQPEPVPGKEAEGGYEREKAVGLSQIAQPETETEQNADQMVNVQVRERAAVARSSRTVPAAAAADYERICIYDKYPDHSSATLRLTLRLSHEGVTSQSDFPVSGCLNSTCDY